MVPDTATSGIGEVRRGGPKVRAKGCMTAKLVWQCVCCCFAGCSMSPPCLLLKLAPALLQVRRLGITRAHIEEDAGKLVHAGAASLSGSDYSLVGARERTLSCNAAKFGACGRVRSGWGATADMPLPNVEARKPGVLQTDKPRASVA